jgi:hypothetical protein
MAVTATPIFGQAPHHAVVAISTANTNRDGTGTIGTVFTAGSNGSMIDHVDIIAAGTTTTGVIRLFIHNGSASFLWKEILVTAITPSASVAAWSSSLDCSLKSTNCPLGTGWSLRAATHNAETFEVHCFGFDF